MLSRSNTLAYKHTRRIYLRLIISATYLHLVETTDLKEFQVLIEEKTGRLEHSHYCELTALEDGPGMGFLFKWFMRVFLGEQGRQDRTGKQAKQGYSVARDELWSASGLVPP